MDGWIFSLEIKCTKCTLIESSSPTIENRFKQDNLSITLRGTMACPSLFHLSREGGSGPWSGVKRQVISMVKSVRLGTGHDLCVGSGPWSRSGLGDKWDQG